MITVHVRGFMTEEQRDTHMDTPSDTLIRGTPHNGYVLGERARTLKTLDSALKNAHNRNVFVAFVLEDSEGNLKPTTDEDEAREHLKF